MLRPAEIDRVLAAARRRAAAVVRARPDVAEPTLAPRVVAPGGVRGIPAPSGARGAAAPATSASRATKTLAGGLPGTGINPWWRYQEQTAADGGHLMVNVGTGNMLLQDDDMSVPHKGIALAFRRTYNSQSGHDVAGTDGTPAAMYGNGWTNTFDAHISGSSTGTISVWDVDGARYDYTLASDGVTRLPPPGQHATLVFDGGCGYLWTKKSGTTYDFFSPDGGGACPAWWWPTYGALAGRTYQIIGRNRNTYITFNYSCDNGSSAPGAKISAIAVQTESGLAATLSFADVSGHRLLQQIVFPDGTTSVLYSYDANGNLTVVLRPPNNAAGTRPGYAFGYLGIGARSVMQWVTSPRWTGTEGGYDVFGYNGSDASSATVGAIEHIAVVNWTPPDGTGYPLQSGAPTGPQLYRFEWYGTGGNAALMHDTDGHLTQWVIDAQGRPTQTQQCTSTSGWSCTGTWLVSNETWDVDNNLAVEVDPRGNETDYLYDLRGNTTAVGEPYTATSQGSFKPTRVYDYDAFNNVTAYCDQSETHAMNGDWTPATTSIWDHDDLCAAHTNVVAHWRASYSYPTQEPYGQLTSMTTPLGYTHTIAYEASKQGGTDFGLPTSVTGASFTQSDGTTIAPAQTFWYDGSGNLRCYSKGQGTSVISYDVLGRMTSVADPDDSSANGTSLCGKTTGQPGWNTQTTYVYNADGSVRNSQSPSERAVGVSTAFAYDLGGNTVSETHHYTCVSSCAGATTTKWYDGADRLVEVSLPRDQWDYYTFPWLTRYIYDFSGGGNSTVAGQTVSGYGNLIATQEWNTAPGASNPSWLDLKGNAFDALDRATKKIAHQPGTGTPTIATSIYDYDADHLGLLTSTRNPENEVATYAYDARGAVAGIAFTGTLQPTPNRTYQYDANGRPTVQASSVFGAKTLQYDAAGALASVHEPPGGNVSSPATISYDYYPDGSRKDVNVASAQLTANGLITYAYRTDGARSRASLNYGNLAYGFTFAYTDGGRMTSRTDPYTSTVIPSPATPVAPGTRYAPQTWTYDTSGQLGSLGMPYAYAYTGISHDAEGHMLGWHVYHPSYGDIAMTLLNSVRGENAGSRLSTTTNGQISSSSVLLAHGSVFTLSLSTGTVDFLDPYNGVMTSRHGYTQHDPYGDGFTSADCQSPNYIRDSYDRAGRMTNHETMLYDSEPISCVGDGISETYTYDAEDHTVNVNGNGCVGWGPDGQALLFSYSSPPCPAQTGSGVTSDTFHYDGTAPLFRTSSAPNAGTMLIHLEQLGSLNITSSGAQFTVADREMSGNLIASHSDIGYIGVRFGSKVWGLNGSGTTTHFDGADGGGSTSWTNHLTVAIAQSTNAALGDPYAFIAADGFNFAGKRFQGARVMDPVTAHWTTPDAYAGDIHDPMSQKPFMWNRNNPYAYSDPSGYAATWTDVLAFVGRLLRREPVFTSSTAKLQRGLATSSGKLTPFGARVMGTFREISLSRGNFGIGSVGDVQQAKALGDIWVGNGARPLSNGLGKISADGSKIFRDPVIKSDGTMQANFEVRSPSGNVTANGHLEIRPGGGINIAPSYIRGGTPPGLGVAQ